MATTVYLPLSSLSRKIILAEYGAEPVQPGRATWFSDLLRIDRQDTKFYDRSLQELTTGIYIELNTDLAERVKQQAHNIGVVIHRHHIEIITRHMLSASTTGAAAKTAMQAFLDQYGIDDDDIDQFSIYREYGRFKKKISQNLAAKSATISQDRVRQQSRIWRGQKSDTIRHSNAQLDALCAILDERLAGCKIRRVQRLTQQAHIYVYAIVGGRPVAALAKKFKRHKANVYRALRTVRNRIRSDKRFASAIAPVLDGSCVLSMLQAPADICTTSEAMPEARTTRD